MKHKVTDYDAGLADGYSIMRKIFDGEYDIEELKKDLDTEIHLLQTGKLLKEEPSQASKDYGGA